MSEARRFLPPDLRASRSAIRWSPAPAPPLSTRRFEPRDRVASIDVRPSRAHPDERLVSLLKPRSFEAEQYGTLRQILEHRRATAGMQVLAVSSPGIGDGKTLTTINVAGALAQTQGVRVLLIDGDLRCPAVASRLGLETPGRPGLAGAIAEDGVPLRSALHWLPAWNLSVLAAGEPEGSPYEMLMSPRFDRLIEVARGGFDFILIDCPPLLAVPDCRLIERAVDGFLVVVAAHGTPRRLLSESLSVLPEEKVVGLVFNKDTRPLYGHYGRYGRYYADRGGAAKR